VFTSVDVVELALGDRVVDVDGWDEEFSGLSHVLETQNTSGGLLRDTDELVGNVTPLTGVLLEVPEDDGAYPFDFLICCGLGIWLVLGVLLEGDLSLDTLVDE